MIHWPNPKLPPINLLVLMPADKFEKLREKETVEMKAEYVDHYGDDNMVATAARVSFSKRAEEYREERNERLINFLARENHWAPFSHPQITLRMSAPVSIRTQC